MTHSHERNDKVNDQVDDVDSGFCWGADAIGAAIRRNPRQTHHLLTRDEIKSAKKVRGRWVVSHAAPLRELWRAVRHVHDRVGRRRAVLVSLMHTGGRDLIAPFAYVNSLDQGEAAQQIADKLGMPAHHGAALPTRRRR
jgi:hypothetical protein